MENIDLLSVVIITCNRKDELQKTIESCIQYAGVPCEMIVVDNGSTDGTREYLLALEKQKATEMNYELRLHFSKENLGVSGGRNKGFELAKSDIVFFIDDDAIIQEESDLLYEAYKFMKKHSDVGILAFEIYNSKTKNYTKEIISNERVHSYESMYSYIGAGHMIRKDNSVKYLYPPNLMYGAEERYASIIACDKGQSVLYYDKVKIFHTPSDKTRLIEKDIYRNSNVNKYVIKKLLLPRIIHPISYILFLLRCVKMEKGNLRYIVRDLHEAKKRTRENLMAEYTIRWATLRKLISFYGFFAII